MRNQTCEFPFNLTACLARCTIAIAFGCTVFGQLAVAQVQIINPTAVWIKLDTTPTHMEVVDFSDDSLADIAVRTSTGVTLMRNLGNGSFSSTKLSTPYYADKVFTMGDKWR